MSDYIAFGLAYVLSEKDKRKGSFRKGHRKGREKDREKDTVNRPIVLSRHPGLFDDQYM